MRLDALLLVPKEMVRHVYLSIQNNVLLPLFLRVHHILKYYFPALTFTHSLLMSQMEM